MCARRRVIF